LFLASRTVYYSIYITFLLQFKVPALLSDVSLRDRQTLLPRSSPHALGFESRARTESLAPKDPHPNYLKLEITSPSRIVVRPRRSARRLQTKPRRAPSPRASPRTNPTRRRDVDVPEIRAPRPRAPSRTPRRPVDDPRTVLRPSPPPIFRVAPRRVVVRPHGSNTHSRHRTHAKQKHSLTK